MAGRTDDGLIAASAKHRILVVGTGQVVRTLVQVTRLVVARTVAVVGAGQVYPDSGFSNAAIQVDIVS